MAVNQYKLRLSKDSYQTDLQSIRVGIRANGTAPVLGEIELIIPSEISIKVYMNLAFQPNSTLKSVSASLYMLGFECANGIKWRFKIAVGGLKLPGIKLKIDGSYGDFGHPHQLPTITYGNLIHTIYNISKFTGKLDKAIKTDFARVAITVCEAIRFKSVEVGVLSALDGNEYQPDEGGIRSWGGHKLGDYNLLEDQ